MDPRCSHFADNLILLDKIVPNNGKPKEGLYQIHAGVEIVNRNNIPYRLNSKIQSEYGDTDSKISLAFSDFQIMGNIKNNKDENDGNNDDKKNSPLI
jgi:hypothetical protein